MLAELMLKGLSVFSEAQGSVICPEQRGTVNGGILGGNMKWQPSEIVRSRVESQQEMSKGMVAS